MEAPLMTIKEVGAFLRLSARSLKDRRFRDRIGLRAVRIGRRSVRFVQSDVTKVVRPEPGKERV